MCHQIFEYCAMFLVHLAAPSRHVLPVVAVVSRARPLRHRFLALAHKLVIGPISALWPSIEAVLSASLICATSRWSRRRACFPVVGSAFSGQLVSASVAHCSRHSGPASQPRLGGPEPSEVGTVGVTYLIVSVWVITVTVGVVVTGDDVGSLPPQPTANQPAATIANRLRETINTSGIRRRCG